MMKKIVMVAAAWGSLLGYSSISACCACFSDNATVQDDDQKQTEPHHGEPNKFIPICKKGCVSNMWTKRLIEMHRRYSLAYECGSVHEIAKLVHEALLSINNDSAWRSNGKARSLYEDLCGVAKKDPCKVVKFYFFMLHRLAMDPIIFALIKKTPWRAFSSVFISAANAIYSKFGGNLDCIEFTIDNHLTPIMRQVKSKADVKDMYDHADLIYEPSLEDLRTLQLLNPIIKNCRPVLRHQRNHKRNVVNRCQC